MGKRREHKFSFLHRVINSRRKFNDIVGIQIGQEWIEEVDTVKGGIRDFFLETF